MGNTFDLRKFLADKKITSQSKRLLKEDHTGNPNDTYEVRPENGGWSVYEGDVFIQHFNDELKAQNAANNLNKEQGLAEMEHGPTLPEEEMEDEWNDTTYMDDALDAADPDDTAMGVDMDSELSPSEMNVLDKAVDMVMNALGIARDQAVDLIRKNASRETLESYINEAKKKGTVKKKEEVKKTAKKEEVKKSKKSK